jgi:hypothetical protein
MQRVHGRARVGSPEREPPSLSDIARPDDEAITGLVGSRRRATFPAFETLTMSLMSQPSNLLTQLT